MLDVLSVAAAADELRVNRARIRALIASGSLVAEKVGGVWLVDRASVASRKRRNTAAGRPLAATNAWTLLLLASGESLPSQIDPAARWRARKALELYGLRTLSIRLERRAEPLSYWALSGELRALHARDEIALSGASSASAFELGIVGSDAVDAYAPADLVGSLEREHGLQRVSGPEANVILRAVPSDAWLLAGRRLAPAAAAAIDLCSYNEPRARHAGSQLLARIADDNQGD